MITILPCAGIGSRLGVPIKELYEVINQPMINYAVRTALAYESRDIVLIIAPGKESVAKHVTETWSRYGVRVATVYQNQPLGTGHALSLLSDLIVRERVLYLMPDVIIKPHLKPVLDGTFNHLDTLAWVFLWRTQVPEEKGCFHLDRFGGGTVTAHVEKQVPPWFAEPTSVQTRWPEYLAWNAAILAPGFLTLCAKSWNRGTWRKWAIRNRGNDNEFAIDDAFDLCLEEKFRMTGIRADGWAQDCGTAEGIAIAEEHLREGR